MEFTIARTIDEVEDMATRWLEGDVPWSRGFGPMLGPETCWPLLVYCRKFVREDAEVEPLDIEDSLKEYIGRLEFYIEKAEDERGISANKAFEQVCAYRWLFGIGDVEDLMVSDVFTDGLEIGRKWLAEAKS